MNSLEFMESPLLAAGGAVGADPPDAGVAAHYGDPYAEQRALVEGRGVVDRSHRDVIRITGEDRLRWLNDLSTAKLDDLPPAQPGQSLILSPHGHVEHHLNLVDDGAATWIHVESGEAGPLLEFLDSMRFLLRVEPADVSHEFAVLSLGVPKLKPGVGVEPVASMDFDFGADLIIERSELPAVAGRLRADGYRLAGIWAYEALRIAAGRARLATEADHRAIPHELGWIEVAVHLNKGCYRGQETVARVHNLGHPPRRLVLLHLDGGADALPGHGAQVLAGEAPVGFVGSAARHYELGPIALALIKRTVPVDQPLTAAGIAAAQQVIVAPDAGANVKVTLNRPRGLL